MSVTQVALGVSTLLLYVPVPLAAVHQAGKSAVPTHHFQILLLLSTNFMLQSQAHWCSLLLA